MADVRVEIDEGTGRNERWDAFVDSAPGGSHVQTSRWAAVKAESGWRAARLMAVREERIVGGCQVLCTRAGPIAVGYAPRGPLAAPGDDETLAAVLAGVSGFARARGVRYLKVQPPSDRQDLGAVLEARGFVRSALEAAPVATTLVDLRLAPDELLARMRPTARANIRKAQRRGATVRVGDERDFEAFAQLLGATSTRQGFVAYPVGYFRRMWQEFAGDGRAALFLAEHEGVALTALLVIAWNDTAAFKIGGWSGAPAAVRPNELAHWTAMGWAREIGCRHYDLEGFPPDVERALSRGEELREPTGVARFKLGLGGAVHVLPPAYDSSPSPWLRPLVRLAAPRLGAVRGAALTLLGRR